MPYRSYVYKHNSFNFDLFSINFIDLYTKFTLIWKILFISGFIYVTAKSG